MKLSHIALGVIFAIFIAVKLLGVHVNSLIANGSYNGPKVETNAVITKIETHCFLHNEEKDYKSAAFECASDKEIEQRKKERYQTATLKNRYRLTYRFKLESEAEYRSDTVYFSHEKTDYEIRTGLKIPVLVGVDDPSFSHPNYDKLNSL